MWTLVLLSVCFCATAVMTLALCLCWRKKTPKNEWLGLDGMVTQKNPDENVNHLPSAAPCVVDGMTAAISISESNETKRNVATTNTRRSLPDIPSEQGAGVNWEPSGDNSSEHYATVGQYQNAKRHTLPNGLEPRPSISQHSSISQADDSFSPYEKVKYDKIKSQEHPYAQLQPTTSRQAVLEESSVNSEERISLLRVDGPSKSSAEPSAPSRSRRSSSHSTLGVDIPAASAVAGGIAASPELPYMTPPVNQSNFSGDSQDSSKGYTSISVREPLANIIAQTKEMNKKRELDPHYSTVSDDSDDVYTTIPDPNNQIYTSESETYARIPALPITVEAEVNPTPSRCLESNDELSDELYEAAPQPPSVDSLKQVAGHSHSRQASSSSSIANIGSPKPEKRQANSPLPPPPMASSFDFHADKIQGQRNLDDLYAKVHKNKRKDESDNERTPEKSLQKCNGGASTSGMTTTTAANAVSRKLVLDDDIAGESSNSNKHKEHSYETLKKPNNKCESDSGYEKIHHEEPGYASINGPDSISSSDPGYEVLKNKPPSEVDPNYEELKHKDSNASDCGYSRIKYNSMATDGYSVVNKHRDDKSRTSSSFGSNDLSLDEPNYESMPSESTSEHYSVLKSTDSEFDPNYESVNQVDPNYESVAGDEVDSGKVDLDVVPSYDKVGGRGYENIDTSEGSNGAGDQGNPRKSDPPYERLNYDTDSEVPGYERVRSIVKRSNNTSSIESTSSSGKSESNNYASVVKSDRATVKKSNDLLEEEDAIFQV